MIALAYAALFGWPLIAFWLFSKLPFARAIIWSVFGSFLFLPSSFGVDLPGVPPMDKASLPALVLLIIVMMKAPKDARFRWLLEHRISMGLVLLAFGGLIGTTFTNTDAYSVGVKYLRAMAPYDVISDFTLTGLRLVPFLVGWQYLSRAKDHEDILKILVAVGLFYSVLMLIEIRLSPRLHSWTYGFFPHSFSQQIRGDGFRPVVFLRHGLWVAFFAMFMTVAAAALWRQLKMHAAQGTTPKISTPNRYLLIAGYFGVVLVLCKSLGSLMFGVFLTPLVLLTKPKTQIRIAVVLALIAISYPLLRGGGIVPLESIRETAQSISAERAESLEVRLTNEERLLEHANRRPVFGWGNWSRGRLFDPDTGESTVISDGLWVIVIGSHGWVGYIAYFGLLGTPIIAIWWRLRKEGAAEPTPATSALCLLLGINMIEILVNSTLPPWTWLMAGALLGYATRSDEEKSKSQPVAEQPIVRPRTVL